MKKIIFIVLVLILVVGGLYKFSARNEDRIEAVKPVHGPAVQAVYATGTVEPTVMMPIAPRSAARLMEIKADEGQEVKKGDVLGQMEDSDIQKQLEELQARQEFAEKDFARKDELVKHGAVSKESVDQSKTDLQAAIAAVDRVKAQLGYLQLIAPEDGLIIRRDGEEGELIPANQPVFWLSCCAPLRISAEVDEEDIALVKNGMDVVVRADAFPGKVFKAKVSSITPKGDPIARSYRVRIGFDGDVPLLTGMTAETNIIVSENKNALLVPASAVQDGSVWVLQDKKLQKRKVETGAKTEKAVEIQSGVTDGDLVISTPREDFEEGQSPSVKIKDWKAP